MSEIQAGILVVDDEPLIRGLLERMLQLDGYLVWTAPDGPAAMEIMRQWGNLIDLALIDWCMPVWDGGQTARELCQLDPGLRWMAMTGYQETVVRKDMMEAGAQAVITKPFHIAEVRALIQQYLFFQDGAVLTCQRSC